MHLGIVLGERTLRGKYSDGTASLEISGDENLAKKKGLSDVSSKKIRVMVANSPHIAKPLEGCVS